ncbi:RNA-binding protein [Candidatus Micrarchaeota archaeon]|nr:RNA-binding protein [Candidatus Micrarchaeota archaeon]
MTKRCSICGKLTKDFAEFPCPECGKPIVRCDQCRKTRNKYVCECGFEGP